MDLPIQRERHTHWPVIPGSTLKGILRDACRRADTDKETLFAAFGPETVETDKYAGALSFTDVRILAFPVRSLKGVFAWVSCPAVLGRLVRDLKLGGSASGLNLPSAPEKDKRFAGKLPRSWWMTTSWSWRSLSLNERAMPILSLTG